MTNVLWSFQNDVLLRISFSVVIDQFLMIMIVVQISLSLTPSFVDTFSRIDRFFCFK